MFLIFAFWDWELLVKLRHKKEAKYILVKTIVYCKCKLVFVLGIYILYSLSSAKIVWAIVAQIWLFWLPEVLGSLIMGLQDFVNTLKRTWQAPGWVSRNCMRLSVQSKLWVCHLTVTLLEVVEGVAVVGVAATGEDVVGVAEAWVDVVGEAAGVAA
jgi:hypothetical protein